MTGTNDINDCKEKKYSNNNAILPANSFESDGQESFTAFPPHSSDILPKQQLRRDEPTFPIDSPFSGSDGCLLRGDDNSTSKFSFSHTSYYGGNSLSYTQMINQNGDEGVDIEYTENLNESDDDSFPSSTAHTAVPPNFNTVLQHPDSPTPSTTSSMSALSLWSNMSQRSCRTNLNLPLKKKFGNKKNVHRETSEDLSNGSPKTSSRRSTPSTSSKGLSRNGLTKSAKKSPESAASSISTKANIGHCKSSSFQANGAKLNEKKSILSKYFSMGSLGTAAKDGDELSPTIDAIKKIGSDLINVKCEPSSWPVEIEFHSTVAPGDAIEQYLVTMQTNSCAGNKTEGKIVQNGSGINYSPSCSSAADTEVRGNLSSKLVGNEINTIGDEHRFFDPKCQIPSLSSDENCKICVNPKVFMPQDRLGNDSIEEEDCKELIFEEVELIFPTAFDSEKGMAKVHFNSYDTCEKKNAKTKLILYSQFSGSNDDVDDQPLLEPGLLESNSAIHCNKENCNISCDSELDANAECDLYFGGGSFDTVHGACTELGFVEDSGEMRGNVEAVFMVDSQNCKATTAANEDGTISSKAQALDITATTTEDSYSLSSSSFSSNSSSSTASDKSNSSQGILHPPKRAIGYDPFGVNTDFSSPLDSVSQRKVHFSNLEKLKDNNAMEKIMKKSQELDALSQSSDESDSSLVYLMQYMGCGAPCDDEEAENDMNDIV